MEARETEAPPLGLAPASAEAAETYAERVDLMLDLMVQAFRTDSTRIATFMFGNAVSGQNFSFVEGVEGGVHVRQSELTPLCNLFTSMRSAFDAGDEPFGDGTGPLAGLERAR